jgi:ubiquinone/menaquinone biosynthesis C-methylase UbiE
MADNDQKRLVALGYDRMADSYLERFGRSSVRAAKLAELIEQLPAGASIVDLGCGAGIPVAHEFVTLGFRVTGVDASSGQIERARRNVSRARFIQADMASVEFAPEGFDAVLALYSLASTEIRTCVDDRAPCEMASAWRLIPCQFRRGRGRVV